MSYQGIIGERRVWTGLDGVDLRIAAVRRADGRHEIETSFVRTGQGRPVAEHRHTMSAAQALHLAATMQEVLGEAVDCSETQGDRSDREEHFFAEKFWFDSDGMWTRVAVVGAFEKLLVFVDWGIASVGGLGTEADPMFVLPFARALEVPSALSGAAMIAHAMSEPTPATGLRARRQR